MTPWFERLGSDPALAAIGDRAAKGGVFTVRGVGGSSTTVVAAWLARQGRATVLLVAAHLDEAAEMADEITDLGVVAELFPAIESLPGEGGSALDLVAVRLRLADRLLAERRGSAPRDATPRVIVAPMAALMQGIPDGDHLGQVLRRLRAGDVAPPRALIEWLSDGGYRRGEAIEQAGDFAVRGGIIDVFPAGGGVPVRLDYFGDTIERIHEVDPATQASDRQLDEALLISAGADSMQRDAGRIPLMDLLPEGSVAVIAEVAEVTEQGRGYWERIHDSRGVFAPPAVFQSLARRCRAVVDINGFSVGVRSADLALPVRPLPAFPEQVAAAFAELGAMAREMDIALLCDSEGELARSRELLAAHGGSGVARVTLERRHLHRGFIWGDPDPVIAVVPQHELLHRWTPRRRTAAAPSLAGGRSRDAFLHFAPGDFVVHRDHGIARYAGLSTLPEARGGTDEEFLTLEFDGGGRLHVPAARVDLVQKYIGAGGAKPRLSTLGGRRWRSQKERVGEALVDLAAELLRVQAVREATQGVRYPDDTEWQREFEAAFPWEETPDQLSAIQATKRDMARSRPMDRLICGDVGFGKTEVAIRAAFKAVEFGKQVAVLVPTTVLAEQHERTFAERFRGFPFRVESVSRFKSPAEQREVLEATAAGQVDVLVGTHRLLSADVRFHDLGLVIVDEEQRFGVEHKQRLLELRVTCDVLTLSATPIPRTLHMALLGLRDISSLTTPPPDRRAVVTEVIPWNGRRIQQAIRRELAREGQVFFVHNRVRSIERVADGIRTLVPEARLIVGHGQMSPSDLEEVMLRFMRREADVLISTTIIESGIDIPSANTMFIDDASIYGLADLHQLRGRVGRSSHRAYCYLLLDPEKVLKPEALRRVKAIEDYSMLGAGFKIAMRDLEIRGAGNLLGAEQSGHIAAVGYEMYCQLLEDAVATLARKPRPRPAEVKVEIGLLGAIPRGYIPSDHRRLEAYRRVALAESVEALERVARDLESAYGALPERAKVLIDLAELRLLALAAGVRSIVRREQDIVVSSERPEALKEAMAGVRGRVSVIAPAPAAPEPAPVLPFMQAETSPSPAAGEKKANTSAAEERASLAEVYWRPEPAAREGATLLAILRKRLRAAAPIAASTTQDDRVRP
ncbi:MAG: transcription-repair coupling factor [Phycisphaeraceae bacterium]|nr:transcription-repair coupling factor [Phycisphaeraceae bacterium]